VILHDVFSVNEAHNKALKVERLHNRAPFFKRPTPIEDSTCGTRVQLGSTTVDRSPAHQSTNVLASAPTMSTAATAKNKENSYIKSGVGKCYRCGEHGHRFNECPKRRQINLADYEDEGEEEVEIEDLDESDFAEEQGDPVACVVQKLLCNQEVPDNTQRHQTFTQGARS